MWDLGVVLLPVVQRVTRVAAGRELRLVRPGSVRTERLRQGLPAARARVRLKVDEGDRDRAGLLVPLRLDLRDRLDQAVLIVVDVPGYPARLPPAEPSRGDSPSSSCFDLSAVFARIAEAAADFGTSTWPRFRFAAHMNRSII